MFRTITTAVCLGAAALTLSAQTPAAKTAAPKKETQATLRKEAKITMKQARATALKEVPNGKVRTSELERENGALIYSFDIKVAGKPGTEEVNVDAATGAVAAHEHESPKTEAKEKKAEKK